MTLFFYIFGAAFACALGVAFGRTWLRDRSDGTWTPKAFAVLAVWTILAGLIVGWCLDAYATYVRST